MFSSAIPQLLTPPLRRGLLHYWGLDGTSVDSVTGAASTDTAITYPAGKIDGACAAFNGTTSRITTALDGPQGAASRSVAFWIYRVNTTDAIVFQYGSLAPTQLFSLYLFSPTQIEVSRYDAVYCVTTVNVGEWTHIVATYDGTSLVVYRNGSAGTPSTVTLSTTNTIKMGFGFYFGGSLDEVGIWNRALTASEVTQLYNAGAGRRP